MPQRHRFLEPIHNVKEGLSPVSTASVDAAKIWSSYLEKWWSLSGSNRRPQACKASALPTELRPHRAEASQSHASCVAQRSRVPRAVSRSKAAPCGALRSAGRACSRAPEQRFVRLGCCAMVGRVGVEPTTSRLSGVRSNHLSYRPIAKPEQPKGRGRQSQLRRTGKDGISPTRAVFPG
jgi:hypothetical protein